MPPRGTPCDKLIETPLYEKLPSSYLFTEATSLLLLIVSCVISWHIAYDLYGIIITILIFVSLFHIIWFILAIVLRPKLSKPPHSNWFKPQHKVPILTEKTIQTRDGCSLKYYISESITKETKHKKIICLTPPLGFISYFTYQPLMAHLGTDEYIFLSFDYRGFFGSVLNTKDNTKIRDISIHEWAYDIYEILLSESIECIDYMVGHSMGVQVQLEFVVTFPQKVHSLIHLNGSHGTVFNTALQPVLRIPFIGDCVAEFVSYILEHPRSLDTLRSYLLRPSIKYYMKIYVKIFGSPLLQKVYGEDYMFSFMNQYLNGICDCNESLYHWIQAFQELHSHSVYHLLHKIYHPTLIISGLWDLMLPCLNSFEMARKLPNVRHCCDIYSSHATILENPESCVYTIVSFIKNAQLHRKAKMH